MLKCWWNKLELWKSFFLNKTIFFLFKTLSIPAIGFSVALLKDASLRDCQTIKNDRVQTFIGNGYDKWYGFFTAHLKGLYLCFCDVKAVNDYALVLIDENYDVCIFELFCVYMGYIGYIGGSGLKESQPYMFLQWVTYSHTWDYNLFSE